LMRHAVFLGKDIVLCPAHYGYVSLYESTSAIRIDATPGLC
jgi:hypothetical protein